MGEDSRAADATVPMAVLDRFLRLSQENNEAYAAMVTALDSMSSKVLELTDQMEQVKTTIDREQLAKVVADLQDDITTLRSVVQVCDPQYNVLSVLADNLQHEQYDKKDVQELANAVVWLLSVVSFFQKRRYLFIFLTGVALVTLVGNASEGAKGIIKLIIGLLA